MRDGLLNETLCFDLDDMRTKITAWVADYNGKPQHSSLRYFPPAARHFHRNGRLAAQPRRTPPIARCSKQRCTRAPFKIARDINEDARNHARSPKGTPEFERPSNARKKVEMRFAHLKVQHGFERMRLRGLTGARDEFHLAAIVQNLKTMALRLLGPPTRGACAAIV